jgi:hypothetical protein
MKKVEKTYRDLLEFSAKVQQLGNAPQEGDEIKPRVLLNRMAKKVLKPLEEYEEAIETLRIKHCLKDKETNKIVKNEKGHYDFDADGTIAFIEAVKQLQKTKVEISIETTLPYSELLATLPEQSKPFLQWEDVEDVLSPMYEP